MKIQIKSLRAVNIGPLKDVVLDFTDPNGQPRQNTLIGGANGNGKTTVLELIFGLLNLINPYPNSSSLKSSIFQNGNTNDAPYAHLILTIDAATFTIFYGNPPGNIKLAPVLSGHNIEVFFVANSYNRLNGTLTSGTSLTAFQEIQHIIASQKELKIAFGNANISLSTAIVPSVLFFPHVRNIIPSQGKSVIREDTLYRWTYRYQTIRSFAGSLNSYLIWLEYSDIEEFQQVANFLSRHIDGKKFSVSRKDLKAIVITREGQVHNVDDLSSGEQNLLILLLELRRRLIPNSIVLIDEIENSLHPAFQYKIGEALKEMQREIPFQLIVTSHAPAFLKIFGSENTLLLPNPQFHDTNNQAAAA